MVNIAIKMLLHNLARFMSTVSGMSLAFFMAEAQIGLLVGWCNTTSAVIRYADADLWIMAKQTSAFDYGTAIPESRIYQVRSVEGVSWAEGMLMSWVFWRRPDGRSMSIELVGLDDDLIGGPWKMDEGIVAAVQEPDAVVVDRLYCSTLGVTGVGDEAEILGARAVVRGISRGIRTFTAAPFVFTSLETAHKYEPYYSHDEITYVLARCKVGCNLEQVKAAINANVPGIEALTAEEFAFRTIKFWMLETGVGFTVVITATLGLTVGSMIGSQTLYAITNDHREDYATLLAIGFSRWQLVAVVLVQAGMLGALGVMLGSGLFIMAAHQLDQTPVPLDMTMFVFAAMVFISMSCSVLASFLSIGSIFRIDLVAVFHG